MYWPAAIFERKNPFTTESTRRLLAFLSEFVRAPVPRIFFFRKLYRTYIEIIQIRASSGTYFKIFRHDPKTFKVTLQLPKNLLERAN